MASADPVEVALQCGARYSYPVRALTEDTDNAAVLPVFTRHGVRWLPCWTRKNQKTKKRSTGYVCVECASFCVPAGEDQKMKVHAGTHTGNKAPKQKRIKTESAAASAEHIDSAASAPAAADAKEHDQTDLSADDDPDFDPFHKGTPAQDAKPASEREMGPQRVRTVPFLVDPVIKVCVFSHS